LANDNFILKAAVDEGNKESHLGKCWYTFKCVIQ
jgi:hypothetical protein